MNLPDRMTPDELVAELLSHFRIWHKAGSPEEIMWARSMVAVLGGYSETVLAKACAQILKTRKNDRFPLPAEIAAICVDIADDDSRPALLEAERNAAKANPWSRERTRFVIEQLLSGPMGKQAARDGWIGPLYDECRIRNELPHVSEVPKLKRRAEDFFEVRAMCHRREGWTKDANGVALATAAARLGDTIEKRNRLVAAVVLGRESVESLFRNLDQFDDGAAQ